MRKSLQGEEGETSGRWTRRGAGWCETMGGVGETRGGVGETGGISLESRSWKAAPRAWARPDESEIVGRSAGMVSTGPG